MRPIAIAALVSLGAIYLYNAGDGPAPKAGGKDYTAGLRYVTTITMPRGDQARIMCGDDAFAVAIFDHVAVSLNGATTQRARQGAHITVRGQPMAIVPPDRDDLQRHGLIDTGSDPLEYNQPLNQGLEKALRQCKP